MKESPLLKEKGIFLFHTIYCVDRNYYLLNIGGSRILFKKDLRKKRNVVFTIFYFKIIPSLSLGDNQKWGYRFCRSIVFDLELRPKGRTCVRIIRFSQNERYLFSGSSPSEDDDGFFFCIFCILATIPKMNILEALILGAVQGIAEFLPVSSSGHLWVLQELLDVQSLTLDIFLHAGSLLAVIIFFWSDIVEIVKGMFRRESYGWKLIVATLCTLPLALVMQRFFMPNMSFQLVGITLLITAGFILAAEWGRGEKKQNFTWWVAIALGLVQGISVLPGISRSGLTIAFLIFLGLPRKKSAQISFLLSIPTILGALLFAVVDNQNSISLLTERTSWVGFFMSALAASVAIAWMMKLIEKNWIWFSLYCVLAGAALLVFFV